MREITCGCSKKFYENDSNPNVHYSNPATKCYQCEKLERLKVGEWYQDKNGEYHQKK